MRKGRSAASCTTALMTVIAAAFSAPAATSVPPVAAPAAHALPRAIPASAGATTLAVLPTPLSSSQCLAQLGRRCYSPVQYQKAYDITPLYRAGITGKGATIMVVVSYGSPTLQHDLDVFDAQWGLPATTLDIRQFGTMPPFDLANGYMVAWAIEATLDVQYAHAIAPGAKIVVAATSVDETQGETGFPELMNAEKSLIDRGVGDVISQSFGTMEADFANSAQILKLRYAYKDAAAHHVTVLAPDSDNGATGIALDGNSLLPFADSAWPASDPLVTAIGGSFPLIADDGTRLAPDVVANDNVLGVPSDVYPIVSGGGESTVFARPSWQAGLSIISGNHRAQPDISMSAAHAGAGWSYQSFVPSEAGWHLIGGTSESCPLFAGVAALAEQAAGHRLGNIDSALYLLGHLSQVPWAGAGTGIVDITSGNNSDHGVTGHNAGPGYDEASGWGTVDVAEFVPALVLADDLTHR